LHGQPANPDEGGGSDDGEGNTSHRSGPGDGGDVAYRSRRQVR
jgi:hypothetical protein